MFEVVIQCIGMFEDAIRKLDDTIRKMAAAEALLRIQNNDYRLQRQQQHRAVPPTSNGFARRNYWLRIRSNPYSRKRHRQRAEAKQGTKTVNR